MLHSITVFKYEYCPIYTLEENSSQDCRELVGFPGHFNRVTFLSERECILFNTSQYGQFRLLYLFFCYCLMSINQEEEMSTEEP